jgi:hypothetical protein
MAHSKNLINHPKLFDASTSCGKDGEPRRRLKGIRTGTAQARSVPRFKETDQAKPIAFGTYGALTPFPP